MTLSDISGNTYHVTISGTATATLPANEAYYMQSQNGGVLMTPNLAITPGSSVGTSIGGPFSFVQTEWALLPGQNGVYGIASFATDLALDDSGMSLQIGTPIIQWPYWGGPSQQWTMRPQGTDSSGVELFSVENVYSGMILNTPGTFTRASDSMDQWPFWGGPNQQWTFTAIANAAPPFSGEYLLRSRMDGQLLEIASAGQQPPGTPNVGAGADQASLGSQEPIPYQQQWLLIPKDDGFYTLTNVASGLVLSVPQGSMTAGVQVDQEWFINVPYQEWQITPAENGYYKIVSRQSGLVLDVRGMNVQPGTPIIQYDYWGGPNQQWQLTPHLDPNLLPQVN